MDIKKLKEELAKMPEYGFKGNMFVGKSSPLPLKYGKPITPMIKRLSKKWGIPVKEYGLPDISDFGDVDATAFLSKFKRTNDVTYWDEISNNGITGETFTNGENN